MAAPKVAEVLLDPKLGQSLENKDSALSQAVKYQDFGAKSAFLQKWSNMHGHLSRNLRLLRMDENMSP